MTISVTTEKFFDMEEACAAKVALEEDLRLAAEELAPAGRDLSASKSGRGVLPRPAYEGLDADLLAASEYLKEPLTAATSSQAPLSSSSSAAAAAVSSSDGASPKQQTARSSAGETRRYVHTILLNFSPCNYLI